MSDAALALKKRQMEDFFAYHPDSIDIGVLDGGGGSIVRTVPGLFDHAVQGQDARQMGAVEFHKRMPSLTIYTGNAQYFVNGTTWIRFSGKEYLIREKSDDESPGSYQTVLWLV